MDFLTSTVRLLAPTFANCMHPSYTISSAQDTSDIHFRIYYSSRRVEVSIVAPCRSHLSVYNRTHTAAVHNIRVVKAIK